MAYTLTSVDTLPEGGTNFQNPIDTIGAQAIERESRLSRDLIAAAFSVGLMTAPTQAVAQEQTPIQLAQGPASAGTVVSDGRVSLLGPDGTLDILDQFGGTIANMSPEFFRELFPQATKGFSQEQIATFLEAFGGLDSADIGTRLREFGSFPTYLQRQTIETVLTALPENTRSTTARFISNVMGINGTEERLYRIANGEIDGLASLILIEDDLRAFHRQYPIAFDLIYTHEKIAYLIGMYEIYETRVDAYVTTLNSRRDVLTGQAESLRGQVEFLRSLRGIS